MIALQCRGTMRTEPAKISGKPVMCRALHLGIHWFVQAGRAERVLERSCCSGDAVLREGNSSMGLTWKEYS